VVTERKVFRLGLVLSCAAHFLLIVLFPTFRAEVQKLPRYIEVSLVAPAPKPAQGESPAPAKRTPPPEQPKPKKVAPVKLEPKPESKVPVMTPTAKAPTEREVVVPIPHEEPVVTPTREPEPPEVSRPVPGDRVSRAPRIPGEGDRVMPKTESPVRGEFSYERRMGDAEGTGLEPGEATPGFRFEGLGGRRVERAVVPQYPREAEQRGLTGDGRLKFAVLPTGEVLGVSVLRSSGWNEFDQAAANALRQYLFTPIENGEIEEHEVEFEFSF